MDLLPEELIAVVADDMINDGCYYYLYQFGMVCKLYRKIVASRILYDAPYLKWHWRQPQKRAEQTERLCRLFSACPDELDNIRYNNIPNRYNLLEYEHTIARERALETFEFLAYVMMQPATSFSYDALWRFMKVACAMNPDLIWYRKLDCGTNWPLIGQALNTIVLMLCRRDTIRIIWC
jgi:hypothetical protein